MTAGVSPLLKQQPNSVSMKRARRPLRQYQCSHCGKVFKRNEHCIRHERTHTEERPYSCPHCHKSYSRKDLLTRHKRTLHGENARQFAGRSPSDVGTSTETTRGGHGAAEGFLEQRSPNGSERAHMSENIFDPALSASETLTTEIHAHEAHYSMRQMDNSPAPALELPPSRVPSASGGLSINSLRQLELSLFAGLTNNSEMYSSRASGALTADSEPLQQRQERPNTTETTSSPQRQSFSQPEEPLHAQHYVPVVSTASLQQQLVGLNPLQSPQSDMASHVDLDFSFSPLRNDHFDSPIDQAMPSYSDWMGAHPTPSMELTGQPLPDRLSMEHASLGSNPPTGNSNTQKPSSTSPCQSPRDIPILLEDSCPITRSFVIDQAVYERIREDAAEYCTGSNMKDELPPAKICQGFLSSYVECFHVHFPVIHLQTMSLGTTPSPLIFIMCSIGALYRLERRRARRFYDLAAQSIQANSYSTEHSEPHVRSAPQWVVQTKLLVSLYAVLNGDRDLVSSSMCGNGYYTLIYGAIRLGLAEDNPHVTTMAWGDWVTRESWKRLLGGIYILSTFQMVIYGVNSGLCQSQDLDIEMFHDDSLWNAATVTEWRQLRSKQAKQKRRSIKTILADIMADNAQQPSSESYHISPFSAIFVMHAVVLQMWQICQILRTFVCPSARPLDQDSLDSILLRSALKSLDRCRDFLKSNQAKVVDDPFDATLTSLAANCQATLKIAHTTLLDVSTNFNRMSLLSLDTKALEVSILEFASARHELGPNMLRAVETSMEGFRTPVRLGYMLVRKTAALRWSVEHAIAGWDCAMFVTSWIHSKEIDALNSVEATAEERALLASMRDVLEEADYDPGDSKSLAAGLARTWSLFLQDVWVWGITLKMGSILEQLATAYERVNRDNRPAGST